MGPILWAVCPGRGYQQADVNLNNFQNKIEYNINRNRMLLVPFDVGNNGEPTTVNGKRAHWGIVFGFFNPPVSGVHCVLANHWGAYFYWETGNLARSCDQLKEDPKATNRST
jgi:hypothetical protein